MTEFKRTNWKFYKKATIVGIKTQWHEIDHAEAQDIIYRSGIRRASIHIKRLIHYSNANVMVGNTILKLEEMTNEIN